MMSKDQVTSMAQHGETLVNLGFSPGDFRTFDLPSIDIVAYNAEALIKAGFSLYEITQMNAETLVRLVNDLKELALVPEPVGSVDSQVDTACPVAADCHDVKALGEFQE